MTHRPVADLRIPLWNRICQGPDNAFLAEGVNRGLDFEGALKRTDDPQLVKFQGSPQVRHLHVLSKPWARTLRRLGFAKGITRLQWMVAYLD